MSTNPPPLRELVESWAFGWAAARELPVEQLHGGWCVTVNDVSRRLEYVVSAPDREEFTSLVSLTEGHPDVWLTVFATSSVDAYRRRAPSLEVAADDEAFMASRLTTQAVPAGLLAATDGARTDVRFEESGRITAMGSVAVVEECAVFDRVETMPGYGRRGYGSQIMAGLTALAFDQGARHGVLAASADGQHLYRHLGWEVTAQMISLRGRHLD